MKLTELVYNMACFYIITTHISILNWSFEPDKYHFNMKLLSVRVYDEHCYIFYDHVKSREEVLEEVNSVSKEFQIFLGDMNMDFVRLENYNRDLKYLVEEDELVNLLKRLEKH
uniref:Uncharacterized protein n=1 Tax=Lepeophtheirus salmonis TaxID=72036 RepID=A0A0K2V6C5_LEPSM